MADEKIYTINLTDAWNAPYKKRAKKAMWLIQEFVKRHTKAKVAKVTQNINEEIWGRGAKSPPRAIKVQLVKENDDTYWAELEGVKFELPKKPEAMKAAKKKEEKEEAKPAEEPKAEETSNALEVRKRESVSEKKAAEEPEAEEKEKKHEEHKEKEETAPAKKAEKKTAEHKEAAK